MFRSTPHTKSLPLQLTGLFLLAGCSPSESEIQDMVERQMDAMVFVEGGEFMMGNPGGWSVRSDTIPTFDVILDDFYIQKYEVTQGDFELFKSITGYSPTDQFYKKERSENPDRFAPDLPAVASWKDATAFCNWLGQQTGKNVDLPTEAQWEFAARGRGKMLQYATPDGEVIPDETMAAAPSDYNSVGEKVRKLQPTPPGSFPPNPLGLYDMSGNAAEWVRDYYRKDAYKIAKEKAPLRNPEGPETGEQGLFNEPQRVLRGGHFREFRGNTTATRLNMSESLASAITGFRCAMKPDS